MSRAYFVAAYYASWLAFGVVGLALNIGCALLLPWAGRAGLASRVRAVIRALFDLWVRWFHACKVVDVRWVGFEKPLEPGVLYVANHPTLVDATFILARLPNAFCIFKPSLMRNPAIGPAAIMARYVAGEHAVGALRSASERLAEGGSLLVFPEGTRTSQGGVLEPFKPGFAAAAQQAGVPVQLILIRASKGLVPRGRAWWRPPEQLPAWIEITLDARWERDSGLRAIELSQAVEARVRERLGPKGPWGSRGS